MFHSVPLCFIMSYFNILQCDLASTLNFCSWLDGEWDGAAAEQANDTANDTETTEPKCAKRGTKPAALAVNPVPMEERKELKRFFSLIVPRFSCVI